MSALQWALLVLGAAAVIAIYITSRRGHKLPKDWSPPGAGAAGGRAPKVPGTDQMDMFESKREGEYDEFGVGKPRKRLEPGLGQGETAPLFGQPSRNEPVAEPPKKVFEEKIVTLLIAEREGTAIFGPKIHQALADTGLQYGDRKIYHRLGSDGEPVFSVASLIKPGTLDPVEQQSFSTPGLTVFMVLPNGTKPRDALQDLVTTTRALAEQLNAEVFDANRQVFTPEAQRVLAAEVDAWTKRNGL